MKEDKKEKVKKNIAKILDSIFKEHKKDDGTLDWDHMPSKDVLLIGDLYEKSKGDLEEVLKEKYDTTLLEIGFIIPVKEKKEKKGMITGMCGRCGCTLEVGINERFPFECPEDQGGCGRKTIWLSKECIYKDGNGSPIPLRIANYIMKSHIFKVSPKTKVIHYYEGGYYQNDGEDIIRKDVQRMLGDESKSYWQSEVVNCVQTEMITNEANPDEENAHIINMKNGLFNIETMEMEDHTPDKFITMQLPVEYDPNADCPEIKKFVSEVVYEDDVPLIQEMFGYCLYRKYPFQKAFMLVGGGSNGKSTLLSLLQSVLGMKNISGVELKDLDQRFTTAHLVDKLANISQEIPGEKITNTTTFKKLTGGCDIITAELKFKGFVQFINYAKLIFSANKIPTVEDDTDAYFRRWNLIAFPNKFEGDNVIPQHKLLAKLTTPEEMSGLFNWMIEGLQRVLTNGGFSRSESTEDIKDNYQRQANSVFAFIKDCTEESIDGWTAKDDIFNTYCAYCREYKLSMKQKNMFAKDLPMYRKVKDSKHTVHPKKGKKKRIKTWDFIMLKTECRERYLGIGKKGGRGGRDGRVYSLIKFKGDENNENNNKKLNLENTPTTPSTPSTKNPSRPHDNGNCGDNPKKDNSTPRHCIDCRHFGNQNHIGDRNECNKTHRLVSRSDNASGCEYFERSSNDD